MIKKFNKYNESFKDKLKGPELKGIQLKVFNATKQLNLLNINTSKIKSYNGIYSFHITNIKRIDISIYYLNYEKMKNNWSDKYLKNVDEGWTVYFHNGKKLEGHGKEDLYNIVNRWVAYAEKQKK